MPLCLRHADDGVNSGVAAPTTRALRPAGCQRRPHGDERHQRIGRKWGRWTEQQTESADISARLQELARQLGINQAALARLLGISRQTFNPYFTGTRGAGLPTIRKAAQRSGRTVSWFLGEDAGRAVIGTADAMGRVTMTTQTLSPGIVAFPVACGPFAPGAQAFVDPCSVFLEGKYLLVTSKGEPEPWLAFARERGGLKLLDRMTGELHVYVPERYDIVAVIVGVLGDPPPPLSA